MIQVTGSGLYLIWPTDATASQYVPLWNIKMWWSPGA